MMENCVELARPTPWEEIVETKQPVPQERIHDGAVEQNERLLVSRVVEDLVEMTKITSQDCRPEHIGAQFVDVPLPESFKKGVEMEDVLPQERVQQRTVDQIIDVFVPKNLKECIEVRRLLPHMNKLQHRTV